MSFKSESLKGGGCLVLFGLPFFLVGVLFSYLIFTSLWDWWEIKTTWVQVPATILEADLSSHTSDDSTTYEVTAVYEYQFDERTFQNDRVAVTSGSDNLGSFHQDLYSELDAHSRSREPYMCWVDPNNPSRAVLYPHMRWGLLLFMSVFLVTFGGAGAGVMIYGVYGMRRGSAEKKERKKHPGEPWRLNPDWAEGRIRSASMSKFAFAGFFAFLWNAISWPIAVLIVGDEFAAGNWPVLIALLFPLVGILLAVWAVREFISWRKFGTTVFEMESVPGVAGGHLSGRLDTQIKKVPTQGFRLSLSCLHKTVRGSGDNRRTNEKVLWQDTAKLGPDRIEPGPRGCRIPVRFAIPYDVPVTNKSNRNDQILWKLAASAEVPGVDYSAEVEVPVFKTPQSDPSFVKGSSAEDEALAEADLGGEVKSLDSYGIIVEQTSDGMRYRFSPSRPKGVLRTLAITFVIFTAVLGVLLWLGVPFLFVLVLALVDGAIGLYLFSLWKGAHVVVAGPGGLSFSGGMLGLSKTVHDIPSHDIKGLDIAPDLTVNDRVYYAIKLVTVDGKKHILASQLDNKRLARTLVKEFEYPWKKE
ncbi:MAG TPA: DUF3592 domain-containing protein [Acidobacteriota bacterium]|nr:DUF3592 domain-containing protein [Acidobacteriota bacterium]